MIPEDFYVLMDPSLGDFVSLSDSDVLMGVDVSDPTHLPSGTTKRMTLGLLKSHIVSSIDLEFIPITGTTLVEPIEGNLVMENNYLVGNTEEDSMEDGSFLKFSGTQALLKSLEVGGYEVYLSLDTTSIVGDQLAYIYANDPGFRGLVYSDDFSDNFSDESLVTKRYVDAMAGGAGTRIYYGSGTPSIGVGQDGDFYIDSVAPNKMYLKDSGSWVEYIPRLQGEDGDPGITPIITASSSSSVELGVGSKTFTYTSIPNLGWIVGTRLIAFNSPSTYLVGHISAVSNTSVTVLSDEFRGTGTLDEWTLSIAGGKGSTEAGLFVSVVPSIGTTLIPGVVSDLLIPYNCVITGWTLVGLGSNAEPVNGDIEFDIYSDTYANFPPTSTDSIFTDPLEKPKLVGQSKNTLSGLSISLTSGRMIRIVVDSTSGLAKSNLSINLTKL